MGRWVESWMNGKRKSMEPEICNGSRISASSSNGLAHPYSRVLRYPT